MSYIVINGLCAVFNALFLVHWLSAGNLRMALFTVLFLTFSVFATHLSVKRAFDKD